MEKLVHQFLFGKKHKQKFIEELSSVLIFTYYWPPSGGSGVQRWFILLSI